MYLFFDTETTGFPSPNLPGRDPKQGRVCQWAALLTDKDGRSLAEFSTLVAPDGWAIGSGAQAVHGISDAFATEHGMASYQAFGVIISMIHRAQVIVAHNLDFDWKMLHIEASAHNAKMDGLADRQRYCTMEATTPICRIPKARGTGYKWPKLAEAVKIVCNREPSENAHDAMVDTRDCRDVFFALRDRQLLSGLA